MDFKPFDQRGYRTTDVASGYAAWAPTYDDVVCDEMDLRLFAKLKVAWSGRVADLACGTGRIGAWLRLQGVQELHGLDLTEPMLERAKARGVYDELRVGDVRETGFEPGVYDIVTASLLDEHLPALAPLYAEASRLLVDGGCFVQASYHPQFLMTVGMPTHYHGADGEATAIETHVHLVSDHVTAAGGCGLRLVEMHEGQIDDDYIAAKPKWEKHRGLPISMVCAWRKG